MNDRELCVWLRQNSSGVYRPAADAADRIEALVDALESARGMLGTVAQCSANECQDCREHADIHGERIDAVLYERAAAQEAGEV